MNMFKKQYGTRIYPIPGNRLGLDIPLLAGLEKLRKFGHIQILANSAVEQLKDFKAGIEVKFVAHIAKLAGNISTSMFEEYRSRECRMTSLWEQDMLIIMLKRSSNILKIVAGGSPFVQVLQMTGMCQIVSSSLIAIIDNILSHADFYTNKKQFVKNLLLDLDSIFRHLIAIKKYFRKIIVQKLGIFKPNYTSLIFQFLVCLNLFQRKK